MQTFALDDLATLVVGLAALLLGTSANARAGWLARLDVPAPVIGGLLVAAVVWAIRSWFGVEIVFGSTLTDVFLLLFFTTVGLSAKLAALRPGSARRLGTLS